MTYQLRRLRSHGLIERIPKTHRYRLTDLGFRVALFCTRAYSRILRPGLGLVLPATSSFPSPLRRSFDKLEQQVIDPFKGIEMEMSKALQILLAKDNIRAAREDEIPAAYQKLVEEYYKKLANPKN